MKISTQIGLITLAGLMLLRSLVVPMLYMDYQLRKEYIVKYLCVNRNKPQLHCDGKCYLAKRIAAAQEQEQRQAERDFFQKLMEVVSYDQPIVAFRFEPSIAFFRPTLHYTYADFFPEEPSSVIFHPPLC